MIQEIIQYMELRVSNQIGDNCVVCDVYLILIVKANR